MVVDIYLHIDYHPTSVIQPPVEAWNARQAEGVGKALAHAHINETSAIHGPPKTVVRCLA